jgi:hypothetical protein
MRKPHVRPLSLFPFDELDLADWELNVSVGLAVLEMPSLRCWAPPAAFIAVMKYHPEDLARINFN